MKKDEDNDMTATKERLIPENAPDIEADIQWVPVDAIRETDAKPSAALKESVRARGVLQPVLLNRADDKDAKFAVVDGKRRVAAARLAGIANVPAQIVTMDVALAAASTITTNAVRGANPIDEYRAIELLIEQGHDDEAIAHLTGMPVGTVRKRLRLAGLNADVLDAVRTGKVNIGVAERIAALPRARRNELTDVLAEKGKLTGADVDGASRASRSDAVPAGLFPVKDDRAARIENAMRALEAVEQYVADALQGEPARAVARSLGGVRKHLETAKARAASEHGAAVVEARKPLAQDGMSAAEYAAIRAGASFEEADE